MFNLTIDSLRCSLPSCALALFVAAPSPACASMAALDASLPCVSATAGAVSSKRS
jgi:hypothetical protein